MKNRNLVFLLTSTICLIIGIFLLLIQKNWVVIYWNFGNLENEAPITKKDSSNRKKVKIYFWKDEKFKHEDTVIIWSDRNGNENLKHLVNAWLSTQLDEKIIKKKIELENISVSSQDLDAFISFDQVFDWNEWSIFQKYKLIESLLKTVKNAAPEILYINFFVNNKPIDDTHLNFVQPWPTDGFDN